MHVLYVNTQPFIEACGEEVLFLVRSNRCGARQGLLKLGGVFLHRTAILANSGEVAEGIAAESRAKTEVATLLELGPRHGRFVHLQLEVPQLCHAGEVERRKAHEIGFRGALRPEKLFATMQPAGGILNAIVTGEFQPQPWLGLPESSPADVRQKTKNKKAKAVWALGNVAGDSPTCRDLVLGHGALLPLLAQLNEHSKLSMLRNATWTLSNFCRGKPPAPFEQVVKAALPVLRQLIHMNDEEVLTDACWALSYLSDGPNDKIQAVIESGVCPRLVELLLHPSAAVLIPALRTVGNI
nr:importin subunit alpha-4-like isoform X2 [Ipomoea batatas]